MIEIRTFEPYNWTRRAYEFLDDKVVIKTKSLTIDYTAEINYKEIKVVYRRKIAQQDGIVLGIGLIAILTIINLILNITCFNNPTFILIRQIGTAAGMLACLSVFHVDEFCGFLDENRNQLGYIKINNKDRSKIQTAVQLIQQKTELFSETMFANPQPSQSSIFEFTHWDIPNNLNKSVNTFYADRLIKETISLTEQQVIEVQYSELSGKTQIIHRGNERWGTAFNYLLVLWALIGNFFFVFFPQILKIWAGIQYLYWGSLLMFVPLYLMRFVKQEAIGFYNTNDEVIYWTWISAKNREKIEQIVAFIQQKTGYNPEQD